VHSLQIPVLVILKDSVLADPTEVGLILEKKKLKRKVVVVSE